MQTPPPPIRPFRSVLHLGEPGGDRLSALLASGAERIVLATPDPARAAALERAVAGQAGIEVHAAALAAEAGRGWLYLTNFPELNGLRRPNAEMRALFPGLRIEREQEVELRAAAGFLAGLGEMPAPLQVIVEAAGSEREVLAGLKQAGLLERVAELELRCGAVALYDGAADRAALDSWLVAEGFALAGAGLDDPDLPRLTFRPDPGVRALRAAEARHRELEAKADWRRRRIEELEAEAKVRDAALAEAGARLDEVEAARAAAGEELEAARRETAAQALRLATLQAQCDEVLAEAALLQDQVRGQQAEIDARQAQLVEAAAARATLERERDAARRERDAARIAQEAQAAQLAEATAGRAALERERDTARAAQQAQAVALAEAAVAREALERERDAARQAAEAAEAAQQRQAAQLAEATAGREAARADLAAGTAERQALRQERDAAQAERDAQRRLAEQRGGAEQELQARIAELEHRYALARNELRRTEGQVELIKDLLLRETLL